MRTVDQSTAASQHGTNHFSDLRNLELQKNAFRERTLPRSNINSCKVVGFSHVQIEQVLFAADELRVSRDAQRVLSDNEVWIAIVRHGNGDWGSVDVETQLANDRSITDGGLVVSRFTSQGGISFLVTTSADRALSLITLVLNNS